MKTIYKYRLEGRFTTLELPLDAKVLHAGTQGQGTRYDDSSGAGIVYEEPIFVWVELDTEAPKANRVIEVVGTYHSMDDKPKRYISTVIHCQGSLVWHVYEQLPVCQQATDKFTKGERVCGCGQVLEDAEDGCFVCKPVSQS